MKNDNDVLEIHSVAAYNCNIMLYLKSRLKITI